MKVTLQVNGREMTFSEKELISIVEKHLSSETTQPITTAKVAQNPTEDECFEVKPQTIDQKLFEKKRKVKRQVTTDKVAQKPTEAEWFEVKPQTIDPKLFEKKREDGMQEATRQLILEAFTEMKNNLKKYGKNFKTMMPKKEWHVKTVAELKKMACKLGDHNADWVEQALEWAQRIANGESWATICNDKDTANYYRLVVWKNGYARIVGGAVDYRKYFPASNVLDYDGYGSDTLYDTVPLVVLYE